VPEWAMMRYSARQRGLAALILVDILLKACARAFLRGREGGVAALGGIRLGYVENSSGFGYDQTRILARYGLAIDDAFVVCTLAVFLALALAIHLWHRFSIRPWIKTLAAAAFYCALAAVALSVQDSLRIALSPYLRGLLRSIGPLTVALVLYAEVEEPYYPLLSLFFLAGTIGNCFSLLLPPFAVIDYFGIYRKAAGTFVYANAADGYLVVALCMIALIPAYLAVRRLRGKK
jgi:hypothetical protein